MGEIADALKSVLARIGSFFDLFDLSFFVSGSATLAALAFWLHLSQKQLPFKFEGWLRVLALILACYVLGLLCFALGRSLRVPWTKDKQFKSFTPYFEAVLTAHGLDTEEPFKSYISRSGFQGGRRLYIRLWAEVRQREALTPSLLVLNRYWVMAATYDGMTTALVVWVIVFLLWWTGWGISSKLPFTVALPAIVTLLFCAYMCSREASRFVRNQIEELIATVAFERNRRS